MAIKKFKLADIKKLFSSKKTDVLLILGILTLTLLTNLPLFNVPFIYDDYDFLFRWQTIRGFDHIPELLLGDTPSGHEGVYRPLRSIFYTISLNSYGHNIFFYHIQELFIYFVCIILVYLITQKMFERRPLAFLTALIYALLPIHIDNIANLTANFDTIGVVFFFLSFLLFQFYIIPPKKRSKTLLSLSLLSSIIAYFTYELTLILPISIIIYTFYKRQKISPIIILLYIIPILLYFFFRIGLQIPLRGTYFDALPTKIISTVQSLAALPFYTISPVTVEIPTVSSDGYFLLSGTKTSNISQTGIQNALASTLSAIFLLLFIAISIRFFIHRRIFGFGIIWFYISLLPAIAISLQSSPFGGGQILWGKYTIIASFGTSLILARCLLMLFKMHPISVFTWYFKIFFIIALLLLILSYPFISANNLNNWKDTRPLLLRQINQQKEDNEKKHNDLGVIYIMYGKYTEALNEFTLALKINPGYTISKQNLLKLCQIIKNNPQIKTNSPCPKVTNH